MSWSVVSSQYPLYILQRVSHILKNLSLKIQIYIFFPDNYNLGPLELVSEIVALSKLSVVPYQVTINVPSVFCGISRQGSK